MKLVTAKNYLKSENVKQGDIITFLDEGALVASAKYTYEDGTPRKDFILKVKHNDQECDMRLNATNKKVLIKAFGDETATWIGKTARLVTADIMVNGKIMKTIVMNPIGGANTQYEA
tara:strand:+ start:1976 stop:2326 length:351 start_codon:yes stop_codon:yes gene_type:complete